MPSNAVQPPSVSVTMQQLYSDMFRPLFFPAPADFTQPLLDSFVAAHDELLDNNSLFTIPTRLRETGLEIDGAVREFRRREETAALTASSQQDQTFLAELRKLRLRSRMQSHIGTKDSSGSLRSRDEVLRRSKERTECFDQEIKKLEEVALQDFKEGIRRAVAATSK
ncbi:hypothetical protein FN846DRAFT_569648 [Sphaerosporella brunnea]|uniref:Uncharacterized protein n=1 Tax=Sphaerosporella brunnea TaxID=1250544 RepID=A0A5J5F2M4_9PEZI|nr:hypothetical protein FN846DRAFT_569648 [Sphaerosporella brunnea]